MYLVIETCDRAVSDIRFAKDLKEAEDVANNLLEAHCANIGREDLYTVEGGAADSEEYPPEVQPADRNSAEWGAWCNAADMDYDAHITSIDDDAAATLLDILLKNLCKKAMFANGSACGDGACDDCPVAKAMEMAKAIQNQSRKDGNGIEN